VALFSNTVAPKGGYSLLVDGDDLCRYIAEFDTEAFDFMLSSQRYIYDDGCNIYKGPILYPLAGGRYGLRFRCDGNGFYTYRDQSILNRIIQHARKFEHAFVLERGHILIANNERWLHGRTAFRGERALMRLLLKPGSWFLRGFHFRRPELTEAA